MSKIVRKDDRSNHDGYMLTASGGFTNNGIRICVSGDTHMCPSHGPSPVTGTSSVKSNGKRVVKVGDKAACGAVLTAGGSVELG
jgi:uncharacterized Zn-binding protein involved in type VI secretion